jgi:hypothetical protein
LYNAVNSPVRTLTVTTTTTTAPSSSSASSSNSTHPQQPVLPSSGSPIKTSENGIVPSSNQQQGQARQQLSPSLTNVIPQQQHLYPQHAYPYHQPSSQLEAQQHQPQGLALPIATAGISQTVNENTIVMLDGRASYSPNSNNRIIAYQWKQLQMGVPVTLVGPNTAIPTFATPVVPVDTSLAFTTAISSSSTILSATTTTRTTTSVPSSNTTTIPTTTSTELEWPSTVSEPKCCYCLSKSCFG